MCAGIATCYPCLQLQAMRDARGLHSDLKKTASLELLHLQQVEAEEQGDNETAPDSGLQGSISSAVKGHLLGRKPSRGACCLCSLATGCVFHACRHVCTSAVLHMQVGRLCCLSINVPAAKATPVLTGNHLASKQCTRGIVPPSEAQLV